MCVCPGLSRILIFSHSCILQILSAICRNPYLKISDFKLSFPQGCRGAEAESQMEEPRTLKCGGRTQNGRGGKRHRAGTESQTDESRIPNCGGRIPNGGGQRCRGAEAEHKTEEEVKGTKVRRQNPKRRRSQGYRITEAEHKTERGLKTPNCGGGIKKFRRRKGE